MSIVLANSRYILLPDGEKEYEEGLNELLSSLTHRQATIVRKKIASYKATVRKGRKSKAKIPDVRDVFPQNNSEVNTVLMKSSVPLNLVVSDCEYK